MSQTSDDCFNELIIRFHDDLSTNGFLSCDEKNELLQYVPKNCVASLQLSINDKPYKIDGDGINVTADNDFIERVDENEQSGVDGNLKNNSQDEIDGINYDDDIEMDGSKTKTTGTSNKENEKQRHILKKQCDSLRSYLSKLSDLNSLSSLRATVHQRNGHDIPDIPVLANDNWRAFIKLTEPASIKLRRQQEALWEMVTSEVKYIGYISVISDIYLATLMHLRNLEKEPFLTEIDITLMFANIVDIRAANCRWWQMGLKKMLEHSERTGQPLNPSFLVDAFNKIGDIYEPYGFYCIIHQNISEYITNASKSNELLFIFLKWAESQSARYMNCQLPLHMLVPMPWQRICKYEILLKEVLSHTENNEQRVLLENMKKQMSSFVQAINGEMKLSDENKKKSLIIDRIDSYVAVCDDKYPHIKELVKQWCKINLNQPMPGCSADFERNLLREGPLKISNVNSKSGAEEVYCLLFTDMLLIAKEGRNTDNEKLTIAKPLIRLDTLLSWYFTDNSTLLLAILDDYRLVTGIYLFSGENTQQWFNAIHEAKVLYEEFRRASKVNK